MAKTIKGNGVINGTNASEIIIGGKGNDTITGGKGNDTITGGTGTNTIIYRKGDGNDVINFTKNEDFILQLEGFEPDDMDNFSTGYSSNKRDLILYLNEERTQFITFKDFALRDVTHSAIVRIYGVDANLDAPSVITKTNGNFTGTRLNDEIDASEAELKKTIKVNGRKQTVDKVASDKGLVLNGGAGDDSIIGSKYSDTIIGGTGNDTIEGGKGNDVITGGAGRNTIVHHNGDGNDVIYFSKDEKITLKMDSFYGIVLSPDKKDLRLYTTADKDEYITIKNYDKYASNDGSTDLGRIEFKVGDDEHYDYYALQDIYFKEDVNNNFKGTTYNDEIDASGATKGLRLDGGAGHDIITGSDYSDTILGGTGDDYIEGGKGNDVITGGTGSNIINYYLGDGDDVIYLTKGEKLTINFSKFGTNPDGTPSYDWEEMPNMGYSASQNGRDLIIYVDKTDLTKGSLTLKDFLVKDVTDGVGINIKNSDPDGEYPFETIYLKPENIKVETKVNGFNFTGSRFDDKIDASGAILTKTVKVGRTNQIIERLATDKGLVLNGGAGNDSITGTKYSDTILGGIGDDILQGGTGNDVITGGTGHNTIYFSENDGNDVINLTKGEQLEIQFVDSNAQLIETPNFGYEKAKNGKDIILYFDKNDHTKGSLTIKNFLTKDITNNATKTTVDDSSVIVTIKNADGSTKTVDLKHDLFETVTNKNFTGYWLNDKIDAHETYLTKKTKTGTVERNVTEKGLVLNGGAGNDSIIGTKYSDTLLGGVGDDTIYGGTGNDVITGGTGANTIVHHTGDGNDIINLTKGEKFTLQMDSYHSIEVAKNGKDVLIYTTSERNEYITIKNLAIKDVTNDKSKNKLDTSSVILEIVNSDGSILNTVDLRSYVYEKTTNKNFTGTWLNDKIDAHETYLTKKTKTGTVERNVTDKGLVLNGGAGDDVIYGTDYSDTIIGGIGDDELRGEAGNDTIYGGKGEDEIFGGDGNDKLYGDDGDDYIDGEAGNDYINGGKGNDLIDGGDGDDTIYGGNGDDLIYGDAGNDYINGGKGNDLIYGGAGNDEIYGDKGDDTIYAGDGDDTIGAYFDKNLIFAGKGNDKIEASRGAENTYVFNNGDGNCTIDMSYYTVPDNEVKHDTINLTGVTKTGFKLEVRNGRYGQDVYIRYNLVKGTYKDCIIIENFIGSKADLKDIEILTKDGQRTSLNEMLKNNVSDGNLTKGRKTTSNNDNDTLLGSFLGDTIIANGANSLVDGGDGNDSITSTGGNSIIRGGAGNDFIQGGSHDTIYGGDGNDQIYGGADGNEILGGAGDDAIFGGSGNDTIDGEDGNDQIDGGDGDDSIHGGNGDDYIKGGDGNDTIYGDSGNDTIYGGNGDDLIDGGAGDDYINGGAGNDTIYADDGNDTIDATLGENLVYAGTGCDVIYSSLYAKNTYVCKNDDGKTTISFDGLYQEAVARKQDVILLDGVDQLDYNIEVHGNDVYIYYNHGSDYVVISDYMRNLVDKKDIIIKTKDGVEKSLKDDDVVKGLINNGRKFESTSDNDTIYGSELRDTITAYGADATIYGKGGDDLINGGDGNDTIYGDDGDDIIYGGKGNDVIHGGNGDDQIYGGAGDDLIYGDVGDDFIIAGSGNDTIYGGDGDDEITAGSSGTKLIVGGKGDDTIKLNTSATNILEFNNGDGDDTVEEIVDGTGNVATIKLNDTAKDGFSQKVSGNDLIISYNKDESGVFQDTITYKNFFRTDGDVAEVKVTTNDGYESTVDVSALKSSVASWLADNGFGDIATGMASATDDQRAALNQIFESCQQQILPS